MQTEEGHDAAESPPQLKQEDLAPAAAAQANHIELACANEAPDRAIESRTRLTGPKYDERVDGAVDPGFRGGSCDDARATKTQAQKARPAGHGETDEASALAGQAAVTTEAQLARQLPGAEGGSGKEDDRTHGAAGEGDRADLLPSGRR